MRRRLLTVFLMAFAGSAVADDAPVSFREHVAPILVRQCLGCHNDKKASSGLNITTFARLKAGGKSQGSAILEPGDPDASALIESIRDDAAPRMPYQRPPLGAREIRTLESWVRQGARFDGPSQTETLIASLVDPLRGLPTVALKAPAADPVTSLAFAPDGATLVAAVGSRVHVFDASTGKPRATLAGPAGPLNVVRFTPDGQTLVAAGGRAGMFGQINVFTVPASEPRQARGHSDTILAAEISPDGQALATASYDRLILLWDLATLKPLRTLKDHTDAVYALAFSPDGKTLASAGADRTVKLWNVADGHRGQTLSDATAELYAVAFLADGTTVLAAGVDRSIRAWKIDGAEATLTRSAFAHDAAVLRLVVSADGKTLVSSGEDRDVKLWDLATLSPRAALPEQPDWPQAIALEPNGARLAVGRHDGSIAIHDAATGKPLLALSTAPASAPSAAAKPELVRNASLNPPSPRGATRGSKLRLTLTGNGVGSASEVVFDEPMLSASIVAPEKPAPNRLDLDLAVDPGARIGLHTLKVVTSLGVTPAQTFAIEAHAIVAETEPNDDPTTSKPIALPITLTGAIERPGDVDHIRFDGKQGAPIVFVATTKTLGSALRGVLTLLDDAGKIVAEASAEANAEPLLATTLPRDGRYTLRVADADFGGSANHFYRIAAGTGSSVSAVFPLGIERGESRLIGIEGVNLQGRNDVSLSAPRDAKPGSMIEVPVVLPDGSRPVNVRKIVVADGPQAVEVEPNDLPQRGQSIAVPGGVSARIGKEGDVDHFRFKARKGERLLLEVYGRRLGTPIDPVIEIVDLDGKPLPRAVLRPVSKTEVAFRDHTSTVPGIRLTTWNNLAINDTVLIGREVARVFALPRNPDDDCQFWADQGQRLGFLETTPEHHPQSQPIYKVEIHPPGTTFPPGGTPPLTLDYRNDDGGPGFDKDSLLTFDPPRDGEYAARVADVRGLGDESSGYHLVIRRPQPDFRVSINPENPNIPRGGTALVTVSIARKDGFDAAIDVVADRLPPGVTASSARVEAGTTTALLSLSADLAAPAFSPPQWRITARAFTEGSPGDEIVHELDPGGAGEGWITVTPEPNLKITATPARVVIRPGREVTMKLAVDRSEAFKGRVPIEVRNLPQGVRVLNIGLNGVLVTEAQRERTVTLYAEPWVAAQERPFYAVGKAEAAGTEHSTAPITLTIEGAPERPKQTVSARRE